MTTLKLMVYRHSAFYSPILSAIAVGSCAFLPSISASDRDRKAMIKGGR